MKQKKSLLDVKQLKTSFFTYRGEVQAIDDISFNIDEREIVGLVGESGCGKSTVALSIMRLIPWPPGKITAGKIQFQDEDLLKKTEEEMQKIRGHKISMIFQEPISSLNPVFTVGDQIAEAIALHQQVDKREAQESAINMLKQVQIADPERVAKQYPHELSGGMAQRIMIAIALVCKPALLIADEPTTALDVTIGFGILELIKDLVQKINASVLLITHDLGIIAETCDRFAVMYGGHIVETADVKTMFRNPVHPYTEALFNAIPMPHLTGERKMFLDILRGSVPDLINPPTGCRFHPRCNIADEGCKVERPKLVEIEAGHYVACLKRT